MTSDTSDRDPLRARLERASEALGGAEAALAAGRANNAVNRAYYFCFHVGVALRVSNGDVPERIERATSRSLWAHGRTMDRFGEILANGKPDVFAFHALMGLRMRADYHADNPGSGVSLELADGAVSQAFRLRDATKQMLPWEGSGNG